MSQDIAELGIDLSPPKFEKAHPMIKRVLDLQKRYPPTPDGSAVTGLGTLGKNRGAVVWRLVGKGSKHMPKGIHLPAMAILTSGDKGDDEIADEKPMLSTRERRELVDFLNGQRRITLAEQHVIREYRQRIRKELESYGERFHTSSEEEKIGRALRQLNGSPKLKRRLLSLLMEGYGDDEGSDLPKVNLDG